MKADSAICGAADPLGPQVRGLFAALRHAGEPVSVTGDVNGDTLTVSKLDVASTKAK